MTLRGVWLSAYWGRAIFLLSCLCFATALFGQTLPVVGKAPGLTFKVPGGSQKSLADFQGKVVALEFIQTTCPHCQAASKVMTKLQHELGSRGFQAIDVAINTANESDIASFMLAQQTDFLIGWTDFYSMGSFLKIQPGTRFVVPQLVLIDRTGNIRFQTPPTGDEQALAEGTVKPRIVGLLGKSK